MTKRAESMRSLRDASRDGRLVQLATRPKRLEPINGSVAAVGIKWAVLARLTPDLHYDGFVATRLADIRRCDPASGSWLREWLAAVGDHPELPGSVDPTCTSSLLSTVSKGFGIIEVRPDRGRAAPSVIGRMVDLDRGRLRLEPLDDRSARPAPIVTIEFTSISLLAFGGRRAGALRWASDRGHIGRLPQVRHA